MGLKPCGDADGPRSMTPGGGNRFQRLQPGLEERGNHAGVRIGQERIIDLRGSGVVQEHGTHIRFFQSRNEVQETPLAGGFLVERVENCGQNAAGRFDEKGVVVRLSREEGGDDFLALLERGGILGDVPGRCARVQGVEDVELLAGRMALIAGSRSQRPSNTNQRSGCHRFHQNAKQDVRATDGRDRPRNNGPWPPLSNPIRVVPSGATLSAR